MLPIIAIIHGSALGGTAALAASYYPASAAYRWTVGLLVVWFSLEAAGYLLGFAGYLDNLPAYIVLTLLFALGGFFFLRRFGANADIALSEEPGGTSTPFERRLVLCCKILAALAIAGTLVIALSFYPDNPDSVAYRFARVMLYLGQGNIHHPAATDPRLSFYPLNGVFLYLPDAIYALDQRFFTLTGVACWLIGAATVYALSRELNVSRNAAFLGATLYLLAPAVLVSAASTNDDLISGIPLAAGTLFLVRWLKSRSWADAVLAGVGFGTSFGVKLHFLFYLPLLAAFALALLFSKPARYETVTLLRERATQICAIIALAFVLSFPSLAINMAQTGKLLPPFPENMNWPFSFLSAAVNILLYTAQLFLAPIADLLIGTSGIARQHAIDAFIGFFNSHFFYWVNPSLHYQAEMPDGRILTQFPGVADPLAKLGVWEGVVWIGFLPWALLLTACVAFAVRKQQPAARLAFWLSVSLFLWHLGRCVFSKYVGAAGIYYAFAIVPAVPALAWLWQMRTTVKKPLSIAIAATTLLALAGEAGSAVSSLGFNPERNLREAFARKFIPRRNIMSEDLRACIAASDKIYIAYTGWELRIFHIMRANMKAKYFLPLLPPDERSALGILVYPKQSESGDIPLQIAGAPERLLTAMGILTSQNGARAFVTGAAPSCQNAAQAGFVVLLTDPIQRDTSGKVSALDIRAVIGISPNQPLDVKMAQLFPDGKQRTILDWSTRPSLKGHFPLFVPAKDGAVAIYARWPGWKGPVKPTIFSLQPDGEVTLPAS